MLRPRVMSRAALAAVGLLAVAVGLLPGGTGCAGAKNQVPPPPDPVALQAAVSGAAPQIAPPVSDTLAAALVKPNGPVATPKNILALSAGGQYSAYDAGLLVGWSETGTRPTFDVVTGISGGAVAAAYAFLGEKYDGKLAKFFTSTKNKDLFAYRPVVGLLRHGALGDPGRLEALIDESIDECYMSDLRDAHLAGRRLYIGTMVVRTRRLCVWDMGAIACSGRPDAALLVKKIFQASVSIPGLLPSVPFDVVVDGCRYTEDHADGGPVSQAFVRLCPGAERPAAGVTGWLKGSNLYVMSAGKMYVAPLTGKLGFLTRATSSISAALYSLYRAELTNMYAFCGVSGMEYHLIAVPPDAEVPPNSMNFDQAAMQKLFALGCETAKGQGGIPWRYTPPGVEPGEEETPRVVAPIYPAQKK